MLRSSSSWGDARSVGRRDGWLVIEDRAHPYNGGESHMILVGLVRDQAALHGLLARIRGVGFELIEVGHLIPHHGLNER